MDTRQSFHEYVRLLEKGDAEGVTKLVDSQKREGQRFWRALANFEDFRSGKTLMMYAAAANHTYLSDMLDPWCSIMKRDASGRVCAHFAAATDSIEWMHNLHKRHGNPAVFFVRDSTQQRPADVADAFQAKRASGWIAILRAEEVAKAGDAIKKINDLLNEHVATPLAVLDYLSELHTVEKPALPSEGGQNATQEN